MKNLYQIQEICRLYHIGADSLRYYEKIGLIQPQRRQLPAVFAQRYLAAERYPRFTKARIQHRTD